MTAYQISPGYALVPSGHSLYLIRTSDGHVLHEEAFEGSILEPPVYANGRIIVSAGSDRQHIVSTTNVSGPIALVKLREYAWVTRDTYRYVLTKMELIVTTAERTYVAFGVSTKLRAAFPKPASAVYDAGNASLIVFESLPCASIGSLISAELIRASATAQASKRLKAVLPEIVSHRHIAVETQKEQPKVPWAPTRKGLPVLVDHAANALNDNDGPAALRLIKDLCGMVIAGEHPPKVPASASQLMSICEDIFGMTEHRAVLEQLSKLSRISTNFEQRYRQQKMFFTEC